MSRKIELNSNTLVDEWFEIWLSRYKKNLSQSTISGYQGAYQHVSEVLGFRKLKSLRNQDFYDLFNDMVEFGHAKSTIKQVKMVIRQCLEEAIHSELLLKNPVPEKYMFEKEETKNSALTIEEQKLLLRFLQETDHDYKDLVITLLSTGLRSGEARSMKWDQISFDQATLKVTTNVREYYIKGKRKIELCNPKTKKSKRTIYFGIEAKQALNRQYKSNTKVDLENSKKYGNLVFPYNGKMMTQSDIYYIFKCIGNEMNKTGYSIRQISPHQMRHSFATRAFEAKVNIKVISQMLGHQSIRTTLNIYTHPDKETFAKEMRKLKPIGVKLASIDKTEAPKC